MKRYFKCFKCGGSLTVTEDGKEAEGIMCTAPMAARTSGICGGAFSVEITEEEYDVTMAAWEKIINNQIKPYE